MSWTPALVTEYSVTGGPPHVVVRTPFVFESFQSSSHHVQLLGRRRCVRRRRVGASPRLLHDSPGNATRHYEHARQGEWLLARTGNRRELDGSRFEPAADDGSQYPDNPEQHEQPSDLTRIHATSLRR